MAGTGKQINNKNKALRVLRWSDFRPVRDRLTAEIGAAVQVEACPFGDSPHGDCPQ
jgi:hypothetical protein